MVLTDETHLLRDLTEEDRLKIAQLIFSTWPKPEKDTQHRVNQLKGIAAGYEGPVERAPRVFLVRDGKQIIANALIEPRTIGTTTGDLAILGLGKVCSDPARRGEGLGGRVVRAALKLVDQGVFPFALFQTTEAVRPFYQRLGACAIDNMIVNAENPDAVVHPFEDEVVMRYPNGPGWPAGTIDLRGPGY